MAELKTNDFVEIEYTGTLKETGQVFDTTNEETAKKEGIHNQKIKYGPIRICIGQNQILAGIDKSLIGKEEKNEYSLDLTAENAFGKKNAKLIRLIPTNIFRKQKIQPFVGLEVQIDNMPGIIRTVSGGRSLVDFNHPLSGKDIKYQIKINKKVTDTKEKISAYLSLMLGIKELKIEVTESKAEIDLPIPEEMTKILAEKIRSVIPEIKEINFKKNKKDD